MADALNEKALEAAIAKFSEGGDGTIPAAIEQAITAYLAALPATDSAGLIAEAKNPPWAAIQGSPHAVEQERQLVIRLATALGIAESLTKAYKEATAIAASQRDDAEALLGNLLARIHRDGGHYQGQHGTKQACADADMIVSNLFAMQDRTEAAEARAVEAERIALARDEQLTAEFAVSSRLARELAAAREAMPNLPPVIAWLRNGCDPQIAADDLSKKHNRISAALAPAPAPVSGEQGTGARIIDGLHEAIASVRGEPTVSQTHVRLAPAPQKGHADE